MWGRELRAGLAFVLVSLVIGGLFRDWRRAHETRFRDLIEELESRGAGSVEARSGVPEPRPTATGGDSAGAPETARRSHRAAAPLAPGRLDVDRAGLAELERLPGIGPALASRIVADRERNGPFGGPEGLLRVRGIGPRTLERIRPYLMPRAAAAADSSSPNAN